MLRARLEGGDDELVVRVRGIAVRGAKRTQHLGARDVAVAPQAGVLAPRLGGAAFIGIVAAQDFPIPVSTSGVSVRVGVAPADRHLYPPAAGRSTNG